MIDFSFRSPNLISDVQEKKKTAVRNDDPEQKVMQRSRITPNPIYDEVVNVVEEEPQKPFFAEIDGVDWTNLLVDADPIVIGHGSFGTVIKAKLRQYRNGFVLDDATGESKIMKVASNVDVAVKILTKLQIAMIPNTEFQNVCEKVFDEVQMLQDAESNFFLNDCIARTYGVARGSLSESLCTLFGMKSGEEGVGIVVRFESGGNLENYLSKQRSLTDKLRILEGIARGLTELHGVGIIHSNINLRNVLLSDDSQPQVRVADFSISNSFYSNNLRICKNSKQFQLSVADLAYSAPEMLMNPYLFHQFAPKQVLAEPSRKTDIYAFAVLSWEVMSQNQAFFDVNTIGELCAIVHNSKIEGFRPPLDQLPKNCPPAARIIIASCWDTNCQRRKTAIECLQIYQFYHGVVAKKKFDIFFSSNPKELPISNLVMQHLIRLGYRVWYDQDDSDAMTSTRQHVIMDGITRSTVVVAYTNRAYHNNMKCMFELNKARNMNPPKPIITLAAEPVPLSCGSKLFRDLFHIKALPHADVSGITYENFEPENVPTGGKLVTLQELMQPVIKLLRDNNCRPSIKDPLQ